MLVITLAFPTVTGVHASSQRGTWDDPSFRLIMEWDRKLFSGFISVQLVSLPPLTRMTGWQKGFVLLKQPTPNYLQTDTYFSVFSQASPRYTKCNRRHPVLHLLLLKVMRCLCRRGIRWSLFHPGVIHRHLWRWKLHVEISIIISILQAKTW